MVPRQGDWKDRSEAAKDIALAITELMTRMTNAERRLEVAEKVAVDFAEFCSDHKAYIAVQEDREQQKEKLDKTRSKIHFALLGFVLAALLELLRTVYAKGHI